MDSREFRAALITCLVLVPPGCGKQRPIVVPPVTIVETQRVEVPVPVRRAPPAALLVPVQVGQDELPVFVSPTAPGASSALTVEGEQRLKALLTELLTRLEAWKAWATTD